MFHFTTKAFPLPHERHAETILRIWSGKEGRDPYWTEIQHLELDDYYGGELLFSATIMADLEEDEVLKFENAQNFTMYHGPPFTDGEFDHEIHPPTATSLSGFWINAQYL